MDKATFQAKVGLAEMLKGGVIMDVVDAEQARIAQEAGAVAVMALERVPSQIRRDGGVARASDPEMIKSIQATVSIPVMAKCRIGEGAAMLRTKGEAGTGNIVEGVRHLRTLRTQIRRLTTLGPEELMTEAKNLGAPFDLVKWVAQNGKLPVPNFAAGGIATPADAALCMMLGAEAVFVGSGIFMSGDSLRRARAIVDATTHWNDPKKLAEVSTGLGPAMAGIEMSKLSEAERLSKRGW